MKKTLLAAALLSAISAACAKQPDIRRIVRELAYEDCHFGMTDPFGGTLTLSTGGGTTANYHAIIHPKARHPFETWIQFSCENPATPQTYLNRSIKLTGHGWTLDTSKEDPDFPNPHTTLYLIHGKGWEGAGTTQDQTDGDENRRSRAFNFCIPHKQLALCGSVQTVSYLMWPKESTLKQVLKLLESVEFIDAPTPASPNSTSTP